MKAFLIILFLITATNCFGGPTVFNGANIKLLKDNLRFKTTDTKIMSGDNDNPISTAKSAALGSFYIEADTGYWYWKADAGSSTNWTRLPYGDASTNLYLDPAPTGKIIYDLSGNTYEWDESGTGRLSLQATSIGGLIQLELFSTDSDRNDANAFRLYGSGQPSGATGEWVEMSYDINPVNEYRIRTQTAGGTVHPLKLETGSNTDQIFLATDGDVGLGTDTPSTSLDVSGAISVNGAGVSPNNNYINGGFEDTPDAITGFSITNGSQAAETTNCLTGNCANLTPNGSGLLADKCFTSSQWEGKMVQVQGELKPTEAGGEVCYFDGTNESQCLTLTEDVWNDFKIIEQVNTGDSVCVRVKGAATVGNTYADSFEMGRLKVDGTTKVETQTAWYDGHAGYSSNNTKVPYFTNVTEESGDACFTVTNTAADGFLVTMIKECVVSLSYSFNSNTTASIGILLNGTAADLDLSIADASLNDKRLAVSVTSDANFSENVKATKLLKVGDVINPQLDSAAPGAAALSNIIIEATHYEQKSVLSDATAESTITEWETVTLVNNWVTAGDATQESYARRVGDSVEISSTITITAPPTGSLRLNLHDSLDIDQTKFAGLGANYALGICSVLDSSDSSRTRTSGAAGDVGGQNAIRVNYVNASDEFTCAWGNVEITPTAPITFASGDKITFRATIPVAGWTAKPQIVGTFKPAVRAATRKAIGAASITSSVTTYLDFPTLQYDPDGHWQGCGANHTIVQGTGCRYVVPETGIYHIAPTITISTNAFSSNEVLRVGANVNGTRECADREHWDYTSDGTSIAKTLALSNCYLQLTEGDVVQAELFHTGIASIVLSGDERSRFSVIRVDQAGRLSQEEPKKVQTKMLTADITTDNIDLSDLQFDNLTIGKWYRISGQILGFNTGGADNFQLMYRSAATGGGTLYGECHMYSDGSKLVFCGVNVVFQAVSTSLYFHTSSLNPAQFNGNNTRSETWITLEEANVAETNQW